MLIQECIAAMNDARKAGGFLTIEEMLELAKENIFYDIFSTVIGRNVRLGKGNIFYPNVTVQAGAQTVTIGSRNIFFSGTRIVSQEAGIAIGDANEIGENGILIKAAKKPVTVGNECRLMNGAQIGDGCSIGNGCQVLGSIKMVLCTLGDGGSYKEKNPNERGGVLKGFGTATGLTVGKGSVIGGNGLFKEADMVRQEVNHPNWRNEEPK